MVVQYETYVNICPANQALHEVLCRSLGGRNPWPKRVITIRPGQPNVNLRGEYPTNSGLTISLAGLTEAEHAVLAKAYDLYRRSTNWPTFGNAHRAMQVGLYPTGSFAIKQVLYKVLQDMEMHIGIDQGLVRSPNELSLLHDLVHRRFGYKMDECAQAVGIDRKRLNDIWYDRVLLDRQMLLTFLRVLDVSEEQFAAYGASRSSLLQQAWHRSVAIIDTSRGGNHDKWVPTYASPGLYAKALERVCSLSSEQGESAPPTFVLSELGKSDWGTDALIEYEWALVDPLTLQPKEVDGIVPSFKFHQVVRA